MPIDLPLSRIFDVDTEYDVKKALYTDLKMLFFNIEYVIQDCACIVIIIHVKSVLELLYMVVVPRKQMPTTIPR